MKIVVESIPDSPSDCLFLKDYYKETCTFDGAVCVFSIWIDNLEEENRICPYLIELNKLNVKE